MEKFKVIIVEDVLLELKGTEGLLHSEVPEAEIIATANSEDSFWEQARPCASRPRSWRKHNHRCGDLQEAEDGA